MITADFVTVRRAGRRDDGREARLLARTGTPVLGRPGRDAAWLGGRDPAPDRWFVVAEAAGAPGPLAYLSYELARPVRMPVLTVRAAAVRTDLAAATGAAAVLFALRAVELYTAEEVGPLGRLVTDLPAGRVDGRRLLAAAGWEPLRGRDGDPAVRFVKFLTRANPDVD